MQNTAKKAALPATALAALGVVFGDIGTSPLYALKESFHAAHGLGIQPENVLGILSIIFWCLMLIISIKYIAIVMRADNNGEGGIMALLALNLRKAKISDSKKIYLGSGAFDEDEPALKGETTTTWLDDLVSLLESLAKTLATSPPAPAELYTAKLVKEGGSLLKQLPRLKQILKQLHSKKVFIDKK